MSTARFIRGDVLEVLAGLPDDSVDVVFSSPPFLALRSYLPADHPDKPKEIGSEPTPADFLDTLLDVVEACDRVLAPHGSLVFELGDTYSGSGISGWERDKGDYRRETRSAGSAAGLLQQQRDLSCGWPLPKSLTGIPTLFAWSLAYGRNLLRPERTTDAWRIRNLVAWVRPNPPVGALADKFRPATSYLTVACKSSARWFDLDSVRQPASPNTNARVAKGAKPRTDLPSQKRDGNWDTLPASNDANPAGAPPLDWWKITTAGYQGSHYAVFAPELLRIPIESMCPRRVCVTCGEPSRRKVESNYDDDAGRTVETKGGSRAERAGRATVQQATGKHVTSAQISTTGWTTCGCPGTDGIRLDGYHDGDGWRPGVVLDPFVGSGTTLVAATGLGRAAIGIDLDERNVDLARERVGMFLEVVDV